MTAIVSEHGKLLFTIQADDDTVTLNTPSGCLAVSDPESLDVYFQDGYWHAMPEKPSQHHTFDYLSKSWSDMRSLDEVKAYKWEQLKQQRNVLEFGGFDFEGNIYDSDQVSQGRILGAASAGLSQVWTLADNSTRSLSASQLQQLYATLQMHIAAAHERGRIARQLIYEATSKEQIKAVNF